MAARRVKSSPGLPIMPAGGLGLGSSSFFLPSAASSFPSTSSFSSSCGRSSSGGDSWKHCSRFVLTATLCSVVTSCGAVAFQMLFTTFHSPRFYPQSADWCQSILNAIHNFPLTKFLSSNRLQTGAKAFQMLFISFHSPSFYLQMVCRLLCGNMCPMFGIPVPPPCHVLNLMMVFDKFDSLWFPYMRDVGHMKQTCSGILFCDINRPPKIGWLKKLVMLLCVGIVWHLLESIGESTWPFLSKQWLVVEALHSKNIDLLSLIVDTATDCIDCPSTHRSKSVLHTFCHCSNQNSCTEFLILVTVMAASYYWSKKLLGKLRIPCQVLSPRQPFWILSYTLHD